MLKEFRDFIMRGNVLDLAVGIIIGLAFTTVVNSLVNDIIMPPIGVLIGGLDFSAIVITLKEAQGDDPAVTMNVGVFINAIINFLIVALAVFMLVKGVNSAMEQMRRRQKAQDAVAPPEPTVEEKTLAALEQLNGTLEKLEHKL
ncbi:MAG TPA: large-conductance mechanosensitive channel protein MscL [Aggregatilinea sp.]|uniref:large-conductance mechanosensitive channel protein MscL n=1 Tax=Aggregatilinea sp. TaxID=2806333 RepID=UPI002C4992C6|nr:large-conductance mechanosensitive channel protein MscL [Aggregatilinea sp.]HML23435.1 large-conductance mechanosensitive channel protein MscL [Aggregatilinea sp.]